MSLYYGRMYMLAAMQCAYMPAAKTDFLNHENGNGSGSTVQYSTGQDRTGQDRAVSHYQHRAAPTSLCAARHIQNTLDHPSPPR